MNMKLIYSTALIISILSFGISIENSYGQVLGNQAYLVEGGGFAITEELIKGSQIDMLLSTQNQIGSRIPIQVEAGFVTLNDLDFEVSDLSGTLLMNGRFLTITGTAENNLGDQIKISFTGKLVQHSDEGSVYSFTGRITQDTEINKIIYTTKIFGLSKTTPISEGKTIVTSEKNEILVYILPGSYNQGFGTDYIKASQLRNELVKIQGETALQARYFSPERLTITPGITLTFLNEDSVSHNVVSAKRDTERKGGGHPTPDGKIATGEIPPGGRSSVTIEEIGFIFLIDLDYPWMTMDVVSFPESESKVIKGGGKTN